ncbi:hypothetical protein [Streptomyces sp. NBRC 109706]|uniref:hypothetical protein n=1 Tax=Streptomyces sp. NBRC 109706 TaxID=1550035 RepID=UPI00078533D1|nr:hypothetical protein [Streptomyces sp. NBRC 109706]
MTRRNRTTYTAALAAGALLLTSCGGGGDDTVDDEIAGAQTTAENTPEPEPSEDPTPTEPADDDRPEIDLGPDFENVYEDDLTGDPVADAALRDLRGFEDAVAEVIVTNDIGRPALRYYASGEALDTALRVLDGIIEDGLSSAGTVRYFNRSVTILEGEEAATFTQCRDSSGVDGINFVTGEILDERDPSSKPDLYAGRLELNSEGVWQTVGFEQEPDSPLCA